MSETKLFETGCWVEWTEHGRRRVGKVRGPHVQGVMVYLLGSERSYVVLPVEELRPWEPQPGEFVEGRGTTWSQWCAGDWFRGKYVDESASVGHAMLDEGGGYAEGNADRKRPPPRRACPCSRGAKGPSVVIVATGGAHRPFEGDTRAACSRRRDSPLAA